MALIDQVQEIWNAGVAAVRADLLTAQAISFDQHFLYLGDLAVERESFDRVLVVGAGKAVAAMALTVEGILSSIIPVYGWVNVPVGTYDPGAAPTGKLRVFPARPPGINEPTESVLAGTRMILDFVRTASPRDLCLVLLSGGGSALLSAPVDGITLEDKLAVTRFLSGAGATIEHLNTVRKQLSEVKGGGLARQCHAGQLITLVLSDVLGDPLDIIASGPTVSNQTSASDALELLDRYDRRRELPEVVYRAITARAAMSFQPLNQSQVVVLGNNATAVDAAGIRAESLGFSHAMTAARRSEGSAEAVGVHHAEMALSMLRELERGENTPDCLITGGEPTVQLAPPQLRGQGGRNMHVVLAAMQRLRELNIEPWEQDRIVILSGGTDGEDGPTDAAGATLTGSVWRSAASFKLDPSEYLARSDSYNFFKRTGGLMITGPTHTNVCDLRVVAVAPGNSLAKR